MKIVATICILFVILTPTLASGYLDNMSGDLSWDNLLTPPPPLFNSTSQSNLTSPISNATLPTNGSDVFSNSTVGSNSTLGNQTDQWYPPPPPLFGNQTVDFNSTLPGNSTDNTTVSTPPSIDDVVPLPSPSPIEGGAGNEPCRGMVYDGYLTNCNVYLDSNTNLRRDLDESFGVSSNGQFTFLPPVTNLTGYVVRLEPSVIPFPSQIIPGDSECYDISTLLPERLPLAAKAPETCSGNSEIMLSPLSTLLTMPGVSSQVLEAALNLPENSNIGSRDTLRHALDGNQTSLFIMKKEMQVKNIVSQISRAITLQDSVYPKVAAAAFESLSRAIVPPSSFPEANGLTRTRKLLYQTQAHLYNSMSVMSAMFTDIFQTLAADPEISVTDLSFPEDATQIAIIFSISNMNTMLENYTSSVDDIYKVAIVIQKDVLSSIVSLVNGTVTLDDFNQANSFENLVRALNETSLPEGSIRDPLDDSTTSGETHSSSSLALGLGLGLGLGLLLVASTVYILHNHHKKKISTARTPGIIPKEDSPAVHSLTASPSYNVV